jgi:hypothetical protein
MPAWLRLRVVADPHPSLQRFPVILNHSFGVMAGLVPAIHVFSPKARKKGVDARDKRGHDAGEVIQSHRNPL